MITLAEKLIKGLGTTEELEVKEYVEFVSSTPMTITPKYTNPGVTLQYSLDGTSWTNITSGSITSSANIIYFIGRATGTKSLYNSSSSDNAWIFTGSTNLECNGKLDRLLQDVLGDDNDILTIYANCYSYMFYDVNTLIKAPILQATTLANYCYNNMFGGCTNLTVAPELPATTLANYCYQNMFYNCISLTTAPILQATTLANYCYNNMFGGCTNLTVAPELPATTLANYCYQNMFYNCISLTTAPILQATTLANYCYNNMFGGCTNLTVAPELQATTLAIFCYRYMFERCTNLTVAPELPATTLANYCYSGMFYGCIGLKLSTTMTGIYDTAYRIPTAGTGTVSTNSLADMFMNTGGTFTGTPTINTTYYTENTPV